MKTLKLIYKDYSIAVKQEHIANLKKKNLEAEVIKFLKEYIAPKRRPYAIIEKTLELKLSEIIKANFEYTIKIISYNKIITDI